MIAEDYYNQLMLENQSGSEDEGASSDNSDNDDTTTGRDTEVDTNDNDESGRPEDMSMTNLMKALSFEIDNERYSRDDNDDDDENDDDDDKGSGSDENSDTDCELNTGGDIVKQITEQFQNMKNKFENEVKTKDVEMEYTMKQRISNSQKYIGSSTDTNNDENVQRTFQVEVFIENQRLDSDNTEESKQRTEQKIGNSTKEDTSADELSEDSSEDDNDNEDEENNNENKNNQNENENDGGEEEEEEEEEEEDNEDEDDENEDKNVNENDTEFKVQNDNVKERNDKSDTSLDEKLDPEDIQENENKNSELNEINLKAIITDQSGNLIKYSSEESEAILNEEAEVRRSIDSSISIEISSRRPSSYNSNKYPLRLNCANKRKSTPDLRTKQQNQNQNRNLSFSNSRMRDIERSNQVLLKKILTQKSTYEAKSKQKKNVKNNTRQTSAAVNRKKQQRQIDIDNQVLKRKLEAIAFRNRHH